MPRYGLKIAIFISPSLSDGPVESDAVGSFAKTFNNEFHGKTRIMSRWVMKKFDMCRHVDTK